MQPPLVPEQDLALSCIQTCTAGSVAGWAGPLHGDNLPLLVCFAYDCRAMIERLGRSLKQEAICLEEINDRFKPRDVIKDWMTFYYTKRPHSALDRHTPDDTCWAGLEQRHAV